MSLDSRRVRTRLLMELHEVLDPETEVVAERDFDRSLRATDVSMIVVDVTTPLVTAATLHVLLHLRRTARSRGAEFHVVARCPTARRVFRLVGLARVLRVSATMSGTEAGARGCPPSHYSASQADEGLRPLAARPRGRHHPRR